MVAAVQARVLLPAAEQTHAGFRAALTRAVARLNPGHEQQQRLEGMARRRVTVTAQPGGMSELWALLPAEGAAAVTAAVDTLARATAGDGRSSDQRRADALVDLAVTALHNPQLPSQHGLRPTIHVTVAVSTLLGTDEQPAELAGHGPIPASVARHLAADPTGTWRRLLTDPPTGALLDYGRRTYRPPADLVDFVLTRDHTCRFPGCRRLARHCDLDHCRSWTTGGPTNPGNLHTLCRRHHRLKHHARWSYRMHPDGTLTWTSPTRHRYRTQPPDLPQDTTPDRPHLDEPAPF